MSYRITAICDRCKKEETQERGSFNKEANGWQEVKLEIGYNSYNYKTYLLCKECQIEIGMLIDGKKQPERVETVEERLFNVISEIVCMNQQQG
jgi:hypothetical protein